jgi:hypothetical protein
MKQSNVSITFQDLHDKSNEKITVEFLPCQFQKNIDDCNKDIYFDPITKPLFKDGVPCIYIFNHLIIIFRQRSITPRKEDDRQRIRIASRL